MRKKLPVINRKFLSMKTLLRIFSIALIAGAALVSCGKITPTGGNEQGGETPGGETGGDDNPGGNTDPNVPPRVIIISFDNNATRTYLDGGKPYFSNNDEILLAQKEGGAEPQICTVSVDGGIASITVPGTLKGTLTAVYPKDAAKVESNQIVGIKVPSVQTGLFKDANICMVDIKETDSRVVFQNQIALIAVKVPENTDHIEVTSLCEITEDYISNYFKGERGTIRKAINTDSSKQYTTIVRSGQSYGLNSGSGDYDEDTYYVAVLTENKTSSVDVNTNVKLIDLNFDILYKDSGNNDIRMMGGFPPMQVFKNIENFGYKLGEYPGVSDTRFIHAVVNSIYNLPISFLHEYVVVKGFKMATMNVGAGKPEEPGEYFFWAGLDGHKLVNGQWNKFSDDAIFDTYLEDNWKDCFSPYNTPYSSDVETDDSCTYYRYYDEKETVLSLWDDAAYVNWGGAWRMPTLDDMTKVIRKETQFVLYNETNHSFELSVDGKLLIFPESGYAEESACKTDEETLLWLSTVDTDEPQWAYQISICPDVEGYNIALESYYRYCGANIRPVSGTPLAGSDVDADITGSLGPIGKTEL